MRSATTVVGSAAAIVFASCFTAAAAGQIPAPGAHAAKRGGQLMHAAGGTLHIEGVWDKEHRFKLFVYDAEMRPLSSERLRAITGRLNTGDGEVAMQLTDGHLEARIPSLMLPAEMTLDVGLVPGTADESFHFVFSDYSAESVDVSFELPPTTIPDTLPGILAALREDQREAQALMDERNFTFAYAPAVRARDRLLALEPYVPRLAPDARAPAGAAILAGVKTAWLLHVISDNASFPEQVRTTVAAMRDALDEVIAAFGGSAR
jgi:hypothetical protein